MTNILALPRIFANIETAHNADWRDWFDFGVDLTGIEFEMKVWRGPEPKNFMFGGSSLTGEILVDGPKLGIVQTLDVMEHIPSGVWPFNILAKADGATVEAIVGNVLHGPDGASVVAGIVVTVREPLTVNAVGRAKAPLGNLVLSSVPPKVVIGIFGA